MAFTTAQLMGALLTVDGRATGGGTIDIPPGARLLLDVISEGQADGDFLDDLETAVSEAKAARDEAVDISGISTSDAVIANRITTPGTATETALSATIATVTDPIEADVTAASTAATAARSLARRGYNVPPAPVSKMVVNPGVAGHGITADHVGATVNLNDTSTYALGTQHVSITTNGTTGVARFRKGAIPTVDATGKTIRLWLRVENVSNLGNMYLYLGDDSVATAAATNAFQAEFYTGRDGRGSVFKEGEWTVYDIPWSSFITLVGTPNRAALTGYRLQFSDRGTGPTTVRFGGLALVDEQTTFPNGVVSITCDDCCAAADTVARIKLDEYGMAGTFYPVVEAFGQPGRLTLARAKQLAAVNGWDFGFHAMTWASHTAGLDTMTEDQLTAECEQMIAWAADNDIRGDSLAWPLTYSNSLAERVTGNYFATARGGQQSSTTLETLPPARRMYLKTVSVTSASTLANLQAWVDRAKAGKCWVIFTFHDIKASGLGANDTTPTIFNGLIDYIHAQAVPVRTVGQVIKSIT